MQEDEEDRDTGGEAHIRYQVMPSLVNLRHMRNRLQMAYLGRKLMKWTAIATGREMRKVCDKMEMSLRYYAEEVMNAYLLIARARYFYPNLNKMVLQNLGYKACVMVIYEYKTISGVRVDQFELVETGEEPYLHLGIDKGGQQIQEAKLAWLELIRHLVTLLDLRTSFELLDLAHKNATKRQNVLSKVIIPRTKATIAFILLELEEMAREDLYRIKLVKKQKLRKEKKRGKKSEVICPVCNAETVCDDKTDEKADDKTTAMVDIKMPGQKSSMSKTKIKDTPVKIFDPCSIPNTRDRDRLELIKKNLTEIIGAGKDMVKAGVANVDVNNFLENCKQAKEKIENLFENDTQPAVDQNVSLRLQHLISHLNQVIDLTNEFKNEISKAPSSNKNLSLCGHEHKDDVDAVPELSDEVKTQLKKIRKHIRDVMDLTSDYQTQGLLAPSAENFIKTCQETDDKIEKYMKGPEKNENENVKKIDHLQSHVDLLLKMSNDVQGEGLGSSSFENFLEACKEFEINLKSYRKKAKQQPPKTGPDLVTLVDRISETIQLSKLAKDQGLVSDSVEEFIRNCEDMKEQFQTKNARSDEMPCSAPELNELKGNVDCIIRLVNDLKSEGLTSDSVDDFLRSCEIARLRIDMNEQNKDSTVTADCKPSCICGKLNPDSEKTDSERCEKCEKDDSDEDFPMFVEPPCEECNDIEKSNESEDFPCDNCKADTEISKQEETQDQLKKNKRSKGNVKRIVTVTRRKNKDGTVSEETKTVIIQTKRHKDSCCTNDDYDDQFVALCTGFHNQLGFRRTKSEEATCSHAKYITCGGSTSASILKEMDLVDTVSNTEFETTLHLLDIKSSFSSSDCD